MKLGDLMMKLQRAEQAMSVFDEVIEYLQRDDLEIPTESGVVPPDVVEGVVAELTARKQELAKCLGAAEDVEIEDVGFEALGGDQPTV